MKKLSWELNIDFINKYATPKMRKDAQKEAMKKLEVFIKTKKRGVK